MSDTIKQQDNLRYFYPEIGAGGFTRIDGTIAFYIRLNALLRSDMIVLDYGAGRGAQLEETGAPFRRSLATVQGKVSRLIGLDVDEAVLQNPALDEAYVMDSSGPVPFPDGSFDLIFADWVLEHIDDPHQFAAEMRRVLKSGGWFCARTPNRWGITGIGANLLPNQLHVKLLNRLQPDRQARDVFPTRYRLNSRSRVTRYFGPAHWEDYSTFHNPEPPYVQRSRILMRLVHLSYRLTPQAMATDMHIFLRKR